MKKITTTILTLIMCITTLFSVMACANGSRYELTYVSGLGVSTEFYEYNYIDFNFKNNTYSLKNKDKTYNITTTQTGTFMKDKFGVVKITNNEIPANNYFLYYNESIVFSDGDNTLSISAKIEGVNVLMVYTKK